MDDYVTSTRGSIIKAAAAARLQDAINARVATDTTMTPQSKDEKATPRVPGFRMTRRRMQAEIMGVNQSAVFRLGATRMPSS